jgi:hypothetical protein
LHKSLEALVGKGSAHGGFAALERTIARGGEKAIPVRHAGRAARAPLAEDGQGGMRLAGIDADGDRVGCWRASWRPRGLAYRLGLR